MFVLTHYHETSHMVLVGHNNPVLGFLTSGAKSIAGSQQIYQGLFKHVESWTVFTSCVNHVGKKLLCVLYFWC